MDLRGDAVMGGPIPFTAIAAWSDRYGFPKMIAFRLLTGVRAAESALTEGEDQARSLDVHRG